MVGFIQESGANLSPQEALQKLKLGNQRFISGKTQGPTPHNLRLPKIAEKQEPFAALLSCADSRVSPEIIFDQGLGDIFVTRVAGNTPDDFVWASLEFAAKFLNVPLIVVLGHENCGAVAASLQKQTFPGRIEGLLDTIRASTKGKTCEPKSTLPCAIEENVQAVVNKIENSKPILAPMVKAGKLKVKGGIFELKTGEVQWLAH